MVVYDYSQIETLMTCGDIHGDYKRFFNEIKTHVKSNKKIDEEIHPLIKEEAESKMLNGGLLSHVYNVNFKTMKIVLLLLLETVGLVLINRNIIMIYSINIMRYLLKLTLQYCL